MNTSNIIIPKGKLADDNELKRKRKELRDKLKKGDTVKISKGDGEIKSSNSGGGIIIPKGKLADDNELKRKRKELRDKLKKGVTVKISKGNGEIKSSNSGGGIIIPKGKLAGFLAVIAELIGLGRSINNSMNEQRRLELAKKLLEGKMINISIHDSSLLLIDEEDEDLLQIPRGKFASFYWYERDNQLLQEEKEAMSRFFPQFQFGKLNDGRIYWHGSVRPKVIGNNTWDLMAVYDYNHPSNSTYGGSVKVYCLEPDLEEMIKSLGQSIPHLLRDSSNDLYLCTARKEDVQAGNDIVTSAATSLSWAVKWIAVYEMWLEGDITTEEFSRHDY